MLTPVYNPPESTPSFWFTVSPELIVQIAWQNRSRVLLLTSVFAALGIVVALLLPPEFVSEAKIMPEMGNGSGDVFKRLASVAGFSGMNVSDDEQVDAVRPDLYPNVLQSTPFILYLIDQSVATMDGKRVTVGQRLMPTNAPGWSLNRLFAAAPKVEVKRLVVGKTDGPVRLSVRQKELVEDIGKRVSARLDTRSGVITITARMPDAAVAATVAQLGMDYLTQYVTEYRTEKARQDLQFYTQRLAEARRRYQTAQLNVFRYNDQHKHVVMLAATMDRQRMEAELTIAQAVYTELSRQFEQARLKVQERTPVFKVLEPAQVPLERVSPKRTILVLLFALAGFIIGVVYLLARRVKLLSRLRTMVEG